MPVTPFTADGKLDISVADILTEMLRVNPTFREFIRAVPPNREWHSSTTLVVEIVMSNNVLALELLDKLEEQEFEEKKQ